MLNQKDLDDERHAAKTPDEGDSHRFQNNILACGHDGDDAAESDAEHHGTGRQLQRQNDAVEDDRVDHVTWDFAPLDSLVACDGEDEESQREDRAGTGCDLPPPYRLAERWGGGDADGLSE